MDLRYSCVMENDTVDTLEGINVSFWVQGCPFHCKGCHNPQTWDYDKGIELPKDYIKKVMTLLRKNGIHRNLSVLGGEPLFGDNYSITYNLVKSVKESMPDVVIYVWTGGDYEDIVNNPNMMDILNYIDILVDGRFILEKRDITLTLRGSGNQRVIDVHKSLDSNKIVTLNVR